MEVTTALVGVDWGTHSSKWTWTIPAAELRPVSEVPFRIVRSEVCVEAGDRIFLSETAPGRGSVFVADVKGKLIKNPDAPFWTGAQKRIRLTLGELVAVSLWSLLGEAYSDLRRNLGKDPENIDLRFSLPNWVDTFEGAVGRGCYEQAAQVACHMFANDRVAWSREPRPTREKWQRDVNAALRALNISDESEIDTDPQGFRSMIQRSHAAGEGVTFRFVAESSAAGLAGLRQAGAVESMLLKILVVDVGAGSTDVGYVLRSIPPVESGANEVLCQLPPANTCQVAGVELSRRIVEIYRSRGKNIGRDEAEVIKTAGEDTEWLTHPAVTEWTGAIAAHVRAYVVNIPDRRFLPEMPGLRVLVTGGSGVVPGLREIVLAAVAEGLRQGRTPGGVVDATNLMTLALEGPAATEANRLAVALGAGSEDLPRLSYSEGLDPRMRRPTVRAPRSWTG